MIELSSLTKSFRTDHEAVLAMDSLTLTVEPHSFFTLLGPSGCGKSTLLRCIAGLETPDSGVIKIGDKTVFASESRINMPPNRRRIGMVFQSYAIWPHMTVFMNVAFPLQVQRQSNIRRRVMHALAMVELDHVADRYASRLSGGQQQRIAFARAVVAEPDLLLLDEPLSNLDAALREQMRAELRKLQEELRITALYVTHDQAEALSMSDRIAIMRRGRFVEIASPEELYNRPRNGFTAKFLGGANIVEGDLQDAGAGSIITTRFGPLWSMTERPALTSSRVSVFIRPEKIRFVADGTALPNERNLFDCRIRSQRFVGDSREMDLELIDGDGVVLHSKSTSDFKLSAGERIKIHVDPADVYMLDESETANGGTGADPEEKAGTTS